MTPIETQADVIAAAMGLGPEVSGPRKMFAVAAMVEAIVTQMWRAVNAGQMDRSRIADFNAGRWPSPQALTKKVQEISAKAAPTRVGA
jgi:predicted homoserine dehydrogenase-like protein